MLKKQKAVLNCLDLVLPRACLLCEAVLNALERTFCRSCAEQLEVADSAQRCPTCFLEASATRCDQCAKMRPSYTACAAALESSDAALMLASALKCRPALAVGCAGFLAVQLLRLGWPAPDLITWIPSSLHQRLSRGFDQGELLAKELARLLKCKAQKVLKRSLSAFPQRRLPTSERAVEKQGQFSLRRSAKLREMTLLLIDDAIVTGSSLNMCATALNSGSPSKIYALVLIDSRREAS